jgi:hypothetical protein
MQRGEYFRSENGNALSRSVLSLLEVKKNISRKEKH